MPVVLIETSEEDSFLAVARHIGKLLDGDKELRTSLAATPGNDLIKQASQLIASQQYGQLAALLIPHSELILNQAADNAPMDSNTECCMNVLCHIVPRVEPPSASIRVACDFTDALAASKTHRTSCRLQAMLELFNTLRLPEAQHAVLLSLLKYAKAVNLAALALSLTGKAQLWQRQWKLDQAETATLFAAIADVLALHPRTILQKEAFMLRTKILLRCPAKDPAAAQRLKDVAVSAALSFLGNSTTFSCDLYQSPAVKALADDAEHARTYQLLSLVLEGNLRDYQNQADKFAPVLEQANVSQEDCIDKMRLMALIALATAHEGTEVALSEMEKALDLPPGEAEGWVVRAFGKQLLHGRIDQVKETVQVRSCERRVFEGKNWKKLKADLESWKENLASIEVSLHDQNLLTATSTVQPFLSS